MPSAKASHYTEPLGEPYWVMRCLSIAGSIVSRPQNAAQDALHQLGLEHIDKAHPACDMKLLEECRQRDDRGAFLSLRCRVSWPLEHKIRDWYRHYAKKYGVELLELAGYALDDQGVGIPFHPESGGSSINRKEPFSAEVIRTFREEKGNLGNWSQRRLEGRNDLKNYLADRGVLLIRDWALLGDTSYIQVREAVSGLSGQLTPDRAEDLLRRYKSEYKDAKLRYLRETMKQRGWEPDAAFLLAVAPDSPEKKTRDELEEMAKALRLMKSGKWLKQEADLLEGRVPSSDFGERDYPAPQEGEDHLRELAIPELVEGIGMAYMAKLLEGMEEDELVWKIWQAWANGMNQRSIAEHCQTNQAKVSRILKINSRAAEITSLALEKLRTMAGPEQASELTALFRDPAAFSQAEQRLMNHLQKPEQEGDVSPMQRWAAQLMLQP